MANGHPVTCTPKQPQLTALLDDIKTYFHSPVAANLSPAPGLIKSVTEVYLPILIGNFLGL